MLLRLILVLMLASASVPMPAAAHDAMSMPMTASHAMTGMQQGSDRHMPAPSSHLCVGCMPIADWDAARIAPPLMLPVLPPVARIATLPLLPGEAPTPPPPRIA